MKSPNVPVSRSDQTEKQSGSEALPDGRLAHSSVLFENKKKQLHPQDCRIDPPAVLFCKKTKPHRPGAPRSPPRQRAFRSVRELQSSQQAAPLQFRRSACLHPAKRSAGSGPFGNLRAQPLSFAWTVRILSLTAPFCCAVFSGGNRLRIKAAQFAQQPAFLPANPLFPRMLSASCAYPSHDARLHTDVHNPRGGFSSSEPRRKKVFVIVRDFKEVCVSGIDKAPPAFYNSRVVSETVSGTVSDHGGTAASSIRCPRGDERIPRTE